LPANSAPLMPPIEVPQTIDVDIGFVKRLIDAGLVRA
jgi:hypothetical protein